MFNFFEEWFAIRNRNNDDDIWAGKLNFSADGIVLEAIHFPETGSHYDAPDCDGGTITGYLDYQRPTTILKPRVQSRGGGSMGVDTPVIRAKSRIMANAILKNIHLEDPDEKCFTAMYMDLPAFSSWYAPQLVKTDYEHRSENLPPELLVEISRPIREEFTLADGTNVIITSFAGASDDDNTTTVKHRTLLTFEFSKAIDYASVQTCIWRVNAMFSFLLGHQMAQNPYRLKTNHTRQWNGQAKHITAELLFRPLSKSKTHHVKWHEALFLRRDCMLGVEEILNITFDQPDALFYLMNTVLLMENPEKLSANDFGELIGCLEEFDITINGSGSSREVARMRKALRNIVKRNGTDTDLQTLDFLTQSQPNRIALADRIDRLQKSWSDSGFRGRVQTSEITRIRNAISHGRGVNLSSEDYQKMVLFNYHLCVLSRFHIFRMLGIQDEEIASAFRRFGFKYAKYAPLEEG